ncbi:MAG: class I SAM-dependent methyltransferase [Candidatus Aminicenantes bacterium]|nr:class I SAM-dependent methyltransferase [Candidatus Aminicenantes bacterium]
MEFFNVYEDSRKADAYAGLDFPGTYHLAFRDLPSIFRTHVQGSAALDFGCGTGRSTRFLQRQGYSTIGIDIAREMVQKAKERDPGGDYRLNEDGCFSSLENSSFDLMFSAFTFDNIPMDKKPNLFRELGKRLNKNGRLVNLVCSPEVYIHEWVSFSTKDFPENRMAGSGDIVKDIITDISDPRPCLDILCTDADYRRIYKNAGLEVVNVHRPLATGEEPVEWITETRIPPFTIYVLRILKKRSRA